MKKDELSEIIAEIRRIAANQETSPEAPLVDLRQWAFDQDGHAEDWLPDLERAIAVEAPYEAITASGLAQEILVRLLSTDRMLRRFFGDLGHRSGVIHRNAIRIKQEPSDHQKYRAMGLLERGDARMREALRPWLVDPSPEPGKGGMSNAMIEREIAEFLRAHGVAWPWLIVATVGAFTWYVDDVAMVIVNAVGDPYHQERPYRRRAPTPAHLPVLEPWFWNHGDRPTIPESQVFDGVYLFRGDTLEVARERVRYQAEEVERYLTSLEHPAVPIGRKPDKLRETIIRNVTWLYRVVFRGEPPRALAVEAFAAGETDESIRAGIAEDRRKDVRDGVRAARHFLEGIPFEQPILTLDEYEAGQTRI